MPNRIVLVICGTAMALGALAANVYFAHAHQPIPADVSGIAAFAIALLTPFTGKGGQS